MSTSKTLRLSSRAEKDLKAIASYTEQKWGAVQKRAYLGLIKKSFQTLITVGNIGKLRDDIAPGIYAYTVKRHCVFFRQTGQEFVVLRVLHSSMDVSRHPFE